MSSQQTVAGQYLKPLLLSSFHLESLSSFLSLALSHPLLFHPVLKPIQDSYKKHCPITLAYFSFKDRVEIRRQACSRLCVRTIEKA